MASGAVFTVTNPMAPRLVVDPAIGARAEVLRADIVSLTPRLTGRLAASWRLEHGDIAEYEVSSDVPYARFVEYGTRNMPAAAMVGRSLAEVRGA